MKRLVIISAFALLAGVGVLRLLQYDSGYVLIVIAGKSIEMRFWVAVLSFSIILFSIYWLIRRSVGLLRFAQGGWSALRNDRSLRAQHRLQTGVLRLLEGDYQSADKLLGKAAREMPDNVLAVVAGGEIALRLKHLGDAHSRLERADGFEGENAISVAVMNVKLLLAEAQLEDALSRLLVLKTRSPNSPAILQLLQKVLVELQDWPALERLLNDFDRNDVLSDERWRDLQLLTYRQLLLTASESNDPLVQVEAVWLRMPKALRSHADTVATYCRLMMRFEQHQVLEPILLQALKSQWHEELVELYGLLSTAKPQQQLRNAEQWLKAQKDNPTLLLALGRICLRNQLWGQARDYFGATLKISPIPVVYAELARLLDHLGDQQHSSELYRQGLLRMSPCLPDLPMPAKIPTL